MRSMEREIYASISRRKQREKQRAESVERMRQAYKERTAATEPGMALARPVRQEGRRDRP